MHVTTARSLNIITFSQWHSCILCLKARFPDISVCDEVNQHDVARRHHL